ncbi:MAG: hypothetical protein Q4D56_10335, partial [Bacteroides sp.]|nr:hypothetical protein [Bacteroides sp.]
MLYMRNFGILLWVILSASCSHEATEAIDTAGTTERFSVDSRATANTTYRIMAYSTGSSNAQYKLATTGTYYLKNATDTELTACSLDDEGGTPIDDPTMGLNGTYGTYYLVFVSPGVKNNDDGSFNVVPTRNSFYATDPESETLGEYEVHTMSGSLLDRRAKVGFNFYKLNSESVQAFEINDLEIIGSGADGETVKLYPGTKQVIASEDGLGLTLTEATDKTTTNDAGNYLYYSTPEENQVYVAAAIYGIRDEVATALGATYTNNIQESDYLYMSCTMTQGERENISIRMALTSTYPELLPQHTYIFNITVSSNYIDATIDVYDESSNEWQNGGSNDTSIAIPKETIDIGTWEIVGTGNDWKAIEIDRQVI